MHLKLKRVCNEKENLLNYEKVAVSWMSLVRSSLDLATSVHTGEASHYQPSGEFLWEHPSTCDWWTLVDKYLSSLGLCCRWVAKSSPTLSDPTDYSMPARLHFLHYLPPGVCSKSCPLSRWCHPTISSSATLFSFCLQFFPASGCFPMSQLFKSGGPEYWSFSNSPSNEYSGFISFRIDCIDLTVLGTLKSLLQHQSWKYRFLVFF